MEKHTRWRNRPFKALGLWAILVLMQGLLVLPGHAEEKKEENKEAVQQEEKQEDTKEAMGIPGGIPGTVY